MERKRKLPPSDAGEQKARHVQKQEQNADRQNRKQPVDENGDAGQAAVGKVAGDKKPFDGQRIERAGQNKQNPFGEVFQDRPLAKFQVRFPFL
jgi:hypothetical protein